MRLEILHETILRLQWLLAVVTLLQTWVTVAADQGSLQGSSFQYFDLLRLNSSLVQSSEALHNGHVIRVTNLQGEEYRLVDLSCFLPLSDGERLRTKVEGDALAVLLAIHHFNYVETSPFLDEDEFRKCNVRLTAEIFDSRLSPIESVAAFDSVLRRNHSLATPLPAAVLGAYRSATTSPLAILSGVNDIPQVSHASTSGDFESKAQYPLFGRTVTSARGEALVALDYFETLSVTHVGVIFVTDAYGASLQKAFQDSASTRGIVTESVAFSYAGGPNGTEIQNAVRTLARTQFRIIYAICFNSHFETMMETAYEEGMIGGDYLWLFPGFDIDAFQRDAVFRTDSPLAKATRGIGLIQFTGGFLSQIRTPNKDSVAPVKEDPEQGYEKLREAWREAVNDSSFTQYVRSKLPPSLATLDNFDSALPFHHEPNPLSPLLYDAVMALGQSFCKAGNETAGFTGPEIYEQFVIQDFHGSSGTVKIVPQTGTRDYRSMSFVVWNAQLFEELDESERVQFQFAPTSSFQNGTWKSTGFPFLYGGGNSVPPESLPPVTVDNNLIGDGGLALGYTLMGVVFLLAFCSLLWAKVNSQHHVVRSAQPLFLLMVSLGSIVMASTIIPLGMQEPVSLAGLDAACMASPWLFFSGTSLILSALLSKTRGAHRAYRDPKLEFIHITRFDILGTFAVLFSLNIIVLVVWTLHAPLRWTRTYRDSTDIFERQTESYATCSNDDAMAYIIVIVVINAAVVLIGSWWAYQARYIETEFNESRYIGVCFGTILQTWCMGVPILVVVWDNPPAKFYVVVGIVFITAVALLLLIYVPKIRALRVARDRIPGEARENEVSASTDPHVANDKDLGRKNVATAVVADDSSAEGAQLGVVTEAMDSSEEMLRSDCLVAEQKVVEKENPVTFENTTETPPSQRNSLLSKLSIAKKPSINGGTKLPTKDSDSFHEGTHVLHIPRAPQILLAGGEKQLSREQLANLAAYDSEDEGENQSQMNEEERDRSTEMKSSPKKLPSVSFVWRKKSTGDARRRESDDSRASSGSLRVLHHPRSERSLMVGNGRELSRRKMEIIKWNSESELEMENCGHESDIDMQDISQEGKEPMTQEKLHDEKDQSKSSTD